MASDGLGWPRMASDGLGVPPPAIACACLPPQAKKMDKDGKMKMLSEKPPKWMGFDCSGKHLGVHRPGVGFWLCQVHADGQVRWLAL